MLTMQSFQARNTTVGCGKNATGGQQIVEGQTAPEQNKPSKINQVVAKDVRRFGNKHKLQKLLQWQMQPLQKKRTKQLSALFSYFLCKILGAWWRKLNFEATSTNKFPNQRVARNDAFVFQRGKVLQVLDEPVCNDELWRCWGDFLQRR